MVRYIENRLQTHTTFMQLKRFYRIHYVCALLSCQSWCVTCSLRNIIIISELVGSVVEHSNEQVTLVLSHTTLTA